jgi:hypothetical protein
LLQYNSMRYEKVRPISQPLPCDSMFIDPCIVGQRHFEQC